MTNTQIKQRLVKEVMDYKFHASSIGELMAWKSEPLTAAQQETLNKLEKKISEGKELTVRQKETINDLYSRIRKGPELTAGGKTALRKILIEIIYGYKYEIKAKYTNKGTYVEDDSIKHYNEYTGKSYVKNDETFENDVLIGTPDIIDEDDKMVIDIKSSWTPDSFPLFENYLPSKRYEWQIKAYMYLLGYTKGKIAYVLTDTPEHIIQHELYKWANSHNVIDIPEDIENYIRSMHSYTNVPISLRIKEYFVSLSSEDIKKFNDTYNMAKAFMLSEIDRLLELIK